MIQMAVWMDHQEARIFHVDAQKFDERTVEAGSQHVHRHGKHTEAKGHDHGADDHRFFREISHSLTAADQILVLGPGVTKVQFAKFVREQDPALGAKIVGVEDADHPSDRQIVAHVRQHFHISPPRRGGGDDGQG